VTALVALTTACWILLVQSEAVMATMQGDGLPMHVAMAMMRPAATASYLGSTALMWVVMMAAMMTPAVLPVVLTFLRLDRGGRRIDAALFAGGYLLAWSGFAILATALQWALHRTSLLQGHLLAASSTLAGILLIAAGVYQLTPLKTACLAHCQSPLGFLLSRWQDGPGGALRMGVRHGAYCLGCCWALMLLMFVYGVMSAAAMAGLTVFILAERLLPAGPWSAKLPGVALVVWGLWTLAPGAP
jgi:predicted metal-binding membrane protein